MVLTENNLHCVLDQVRRGLDKFEQRVIDTIAPVVELYDQQQEVVMGFGYAFLHCLFRQVIIKQLFDV